SSSSQRSTGSQVNLPNWLKLTRTGDSVVAYTSSNGTDWAHIDDVTVSFGDTIEAGIALAVTGSADQLAQFDNLSLTNAGGDANDAETLSKKASTSAIINKTFPMVASVPAIIHAGPAIGGNITEDTELVPGQPYDVTSSIVVDAGVTLTIPAGATLSFIAGTQLQVVGELVIEGDVNNRVLLTSAATSPAKNNWKGIVVQNGATVSLDHVIGEYANRAIDLYNVTGATVTVSNSELRSSETGVYIYSGDSAVTITDSRLTDNSTGFYMRSSGTAP
ncbi:MAG: hypothetical protein GY814_06695, partial [Gammaproteobacteria bacterium]|nr:hypothetical protein [Gammaproteobacteria bacterium]